MEKIKAMCVVGATESTNDEKDIFIKGNEYFFEWYEKIGRWKCDNGGLVLPYYLLQNFTNIQLVGEDKDEYVLLKGVPIKKVEIFNVLNN